MPAAKLGEGVAGLLHDGEHLQGADEPVSRGRLVEAQDVAGGLTAQNSA